MTHKGMSGWAILPQTMTCSVRTTFLHVTGVTKCPAFAWPTLPTHAPHKGKCPKPHTLLGQLGPHTAKTWGILAFSAIPRGQTDSTVLCLGANITGDTTFERGQGGQNEVGLTFCYFFSVGLQARWAGLVGSCPRMCLPSMICQYQHHKLGATIWSCESKGNY